MNVAIIFLKKKISPLEKKYIYAFFQWSICYFDFSSFFMIRLMKVLFDVITFSFPYFEQREITVSSKPITEILGLGTNINEILSFCIELTLLESIEIKKCILRLYACQEP
jgi:hypothetical protein